ncbi:amino acid adenylation domain-containing protein [Lentzea sp. JNUCC 0626]|uniref:amino acid adenylation domain-containing protein n=1 Tax=Lentzea sp. JNUCC 0626 TaxID=3367513 RepID=UPI0037487587
MLFSDHELERGKRTRFPRDATLHGQVLRWAERTPHAPAVDAGGEVLTYAELMGRADGLAQELSALGVRAGDLVAVLDAPSARRIVAYLGVLLAGAAYLPLDDLNPPERNLAMVADSGAVVVLAADGGASGLPNAVSLDVLERRAARRVARGAERSPGSALDVAYVMYTSGSTGRPKGIAIPHRAITRLVVNTDYVRLGRHDVVAHGANASFDAATFEIWGALLNGGKIVVLPKDDMLVHQQLTRFVRDNSVSVLFLTPAVFHAHATVGPGAFEGLGTLLIGGDVLDPGAVRDVVEAGAPGRLLNMYGPTEATTFSTGLAVGAGNPRTGSLPIGRPIANTDVCVLRSGARVPIGEEGELHIGGDGLALGYVGDETLTGERFVDDPQRPGHRLYRTGDSAYWNDDGNLMFAGRTDDQVKLRGYRVELGEVTAVLRTHHAVSDAAVFVHGPRGAEQLVGYVATHRPEDLADCLPFLRRRLPSYMVPSQVVKRHELPLTANGKVDRARLLEEHLDQG